MKKKISMLDYIFVSSAFHSRFTVPLKVVLRPIQSRWPNPLIHVQYLNIKIENTFMWDYQWTLLSLLIMQSFNVCVFFRQGQIVRRYQCVKHPNSNKVFIDDINNKRGHRDIHQKSISMYVYILILICILSLSIYHIEFLLVVGFLSSVCTIAMLMFLL